MNALSEEGWYTDPFGRHEARWISRGKPTKLVRDAGVEAYEEPPDEPPTVTPVKIEARVGEGPGDLKRADDAEAGAGPGDLRRADAAESQPPGEPHELEDAATDVIEQEFPPG